MNYKHIHFYISGKEITLHTVRTPQIRINEDTKALRVEHEPRPETKMKPAFFSINFVLYFCCVVYTKTTKLSNKMKHTHTHTVKITIFFHKARKYIFNHFFSKSKPIYLTMTTCCSKQLECNQSYSY